MINLVNVTAMKDQVLEEGIGKNSIARKTILDRKILDWCDWRKTRKINFHQCKIVIFCDLRSGFFTNQYHNCNNNSNKSNLEYFS